ncbi:MAG: menaquinone biosynthesis decarboxylase [Bacteroidales bacterium]|nr:menaquinone biosynthesis decarboxylase [Bacteroidales bacterium]
MAKSELVYYINILESKKELIRINKQVDPVLEIAEIADRVSKMPDGGKALLFENTGTDFPLLINAFGSDERMRTVLKCNTFEDTRDEMGKVLKDLLKPPRGLIPKIKLLPKLVKLASYFPKKRKGKGGCQEIVMEQPDLSKFPILQCWPGDGGRFFTLPMVITKHPETGMRNVGMYRMQVINNDTTAMHWHPQKTGASHYREYKKLKMRMPVAVALGGDPLLTYSATAPLPDNIDEYLFVGLLRKRGVKMVRCLTQEMEVPEEADIIMEGYIDPEEELFLEGPFGDHTGFYSLPDYFPKFHVTCITYRKGAIYPATIVGIPPMEDAWIAKATEKLFIEPMRIGLLPEMADMHLPFIGVAHNLTFISIDKQYEGQAFKVMNALWGAGQMMFNKIMVVFEKDADLTDYTQLAKECLNYLNPHTDIYFGQGPLDILDHASNKVGFGSKLGIDCTNKKDNDKRSNGLKQINENDLQQITAKIDGVEKINANLFKQEIPVLIAGVKRDEALENPGLIEQLSNECAILGCKVLLIVDAELDIANVSLAVWYCLNNIDPKRDIRIFGQEGQTSMISINGLNKNEITGKYGRRWPNIITSKKDTIENIDRIWNDLGLGERVQSPSLSVMGINKYNGAFYNGFVNGGN